MILKHAFVKLSIYDTEAFIYINMNNIVSLRSFKTEYDGYRYLSYTLIETIMDETYYKVKESPEEILDLLRKNWG